MRSERMFSHTALAAMLFGGSGAALAQQAGPSPAEEAPERGQPLLEEIIVTARQVQESLQRTPVSVSAFTPAMMVKSDLPTLADVANLAPNVQFSFGGTSAGTSSSASVFIRGIGQNDFTPVTDPGVGVYLDGVYLGRTLGSVLEVSDAQQVEVLRGPQGTLFGRNNIGGSVSLKTREPGHEFGARIRLIGGGRVSGGGDADADRLAAVCATFACDPGVLKAASGNSIPGSGSRYEIHGRFDIPITDNLTTGVNFMFRRRGAIITRLDGVRLGNDDIYGGRFKAVWLPSGTNTKITFSADVAIENENGLAEVPINAPVESGFFRAFNNNALAMFGKPGSIDPACAGNDPLGGPVPNANCANNTFTLGNFVTAETSPSRNETSAWGVNMTAEFDVTDRLSMKSITAYRQVNAYFNRSPDGTPFDLLFTQDEFEQDQFTQELQFFTDFFDGRVQTVSGLFVMQESARNFAEDVFFPELALPNHFGGETDNFNFAAFSEWTFDISDRWRLLAGGRFTHDNKEFLAESMRTADKIGGARNFLSGEAAERQSLNFNKLTWRFGTQHDLTDDTMAYFTVSRGFKSGGFDLRLTQATDRLPAFSPEFVTSWEVGMKNEIPDYGLRFNWNLFWMRYTNMQISGNIPPEINTVTFNGGDGRVRGAEAELQYSPTAELSIRAAFGYQDAEFRDILPGAVIGLDDKFIRTPKYTINATVSYDFDLGANGILTPAIDWDYKSAIEFEPVNSLARDPGRNVVDLVLTHEAPWFGGYQMLFGINNVTDKTFYVSGDSNRTCCFDVRSPARKRNWFVSLIKEF